MARHIITKEDLRGYVVKQEIAGAYGKGQNKKLLVVVDTETNRVHYEVVDHGIEVGASTLDLVIDLYNGLS